MTNFVDALNEKINQLEDEKSRIDEKIELLQELLDSESGQEAAPTATETKKRPGRPRGSRNKKTTSIHAIEDSIFEESTRQLAASGQGTTPEMQERMVKKYRPTPRPNRNYGGVHAGTKAQVEEARASSASSNVNSTMSIEDENGTVQGE